MFGITIDGNRYNPGDLVFQGEQNKNGTNFNEIESTYLLNHKVKIHFYERYINEHQTHYWFQIHNTSKEKIKIEEVDTLDMVLDQSPIDIHYFNSSWGAEYQPNHFLVNEKWEYENKMGRSSAEVHPFFYWKTDNQIHLLNIAWSGNWRIMVELKGHKSQLQIGLNRSFDTEILPGGSWESIHVVVSKGVNLNIASKNMIEYGEACVFPTTSSLEKSLVSWNHWWTYEDKLINEKIVLENMKEAAKLGVETVVLDAGWFGDGDDWYEVRGDWEKVNSTRFPSGIHYLSQEAKKLGLKFGLWCEIEALGQKAELRQKNARYAAERDGEDLGYVCFGHKPVREWAIDTLTRLIEQFDCEWIKLDFNLDPGEGCNRPDHDHTSGDGLYEHYMGLYQVLSEIRLRFPHLIIENCSSGGLRTDWGLMRNTHLNFLSDPDHGPHQLQVFWGASLILPPSRCYHFTWSQTLINENGHSPFPWKNYNDCTEDEIRTYIRISSMHRFGISHPIIKWSDNVKRIVTEGIEEYTNHIFPFLPKSNLYRLSPQGDRNKNSNEVFQFISEDSKEMLLFIFNLAPEQEVQRLNWGKY